MSTSSGTNLALHILVRVTEHVIHDSTKSIGERVKSILLLGVLMSQVCAPRKITQCITDEMMTTPARFYE